MALSGLEIYKLLPKTNCKECGFPTCLAFAMKLAAKQIELKDCPYVSEEAKAKLEAASAPPIRLIEISGDEGKLQVGNEIALFRHEKTFYHKPGLFWRLRDDESIEDLKKKASMAEAYHVDYVGIDMTLDGFAVEAKSGDPATFANAVEAVRSVSKKPLILITATPEVAKAGVEATKGTRPLLYAADAENWEAMAGIAKEADIPLAVRGQTLDELADITKKLVDAGLEDLVLDPQAKGYLDSLTKLTALRRLAIKENFRPLGFPVITFPGMNDDIDQTVLAAEYISKYAGFIILEDFNPATLYGLMVLRENIYTDPQKPIQVLPGIYEINSPDNKAPLMVTTNFSITYFSVANEIEGSGRPAWLMVADAEGMSVLTAWAAGKFDAERIAKSAKTFGVEEKVEHRKIIIPGLVAVISGELEEELSGWEIMVGPREAVDIASYLKAMWEA
jgi:acetyl-CoA decarbonylase/synthase complex subunit gamma